MLYRMPRRDRLCLMESVEVEPDDRLRRQWRHVCIKCGTARISRRPKYARECRQWHKGFGSKLHRLLGRLGVTPARVSRLLRRPCKCYERMDWLDRMSLRMVRLWRWVWGWQEPMLPASGGPPGP